MCNLLKKLAVLALAMAALSVPAFAQTAATGNIEGVVTDATGAVLPGVAVVVRNIETNVVREAVTDEGGRYRAAALQPGTYEVKVTLAGFDAQPITNIPVLVGQTQPVDFKMRPAGVSETVTVTGETPVVDLTRTDVSSVVGERAIANLPINGRRWENFVLLTPGVTNDGGFGLVSYRGVSGLYNNNTIDGVDNNQAFFSEARGRTRASYSVSQAAIREFQVGVSNFSAEFGRAAGGTVNAVTRSGTNSSRGEGFYFIRDDVFMSPEPTAVPPPGRRVPEERRQQFGVSAGGPIKQDKLFYFVNYDQQLRDFPGYSRPSTDTFYGSTCTAPGCASTLEFLKSLEGYFDREGNNRIFLGKIDAPLSNKHNLTVQYNMHRWNSENGVQTQPILSGTSNSANGTDKVKTDFAVLSFNSVLSPRWLNEFRTQIGRDYESQIPNAPGPSTTITNGIQFGMPNFLPREKYPFERRYQFIDNLTYYAGAHSIKGGFDINYVQQEVINLFQGGGVYAYGNLENISRDCPIGSTGCTQFVDAIQGRHYNTFNQQFDLRGPQFKGDAYFTTTDYNFFIQDTWSVSSNLTVNGGLRYEYQKLPQPGDTEVNGQVMEGNPAYPQTMSFPQDKNNWSPRVGLSYDVTGDQKTVLRAGYGLYFGRTSNSVLFSALTVNAVTLAQYTFNGNVPAAATSGAPAYPSVFTSVPTGTSVKPNIQYLSRDLERPQVHMVDVTIDRQLPWNITGGASYLYSKGSKLPTFIDRNLPAPSSTINYVHNGQVIGSAPFYRGTRPDPNINLAIEMTSDVESTYHGFVLQANKRFSHGLLFNANYTLSKAEDSGQNSTTFISGFMTVFDPNNLALEEGPSNTDRRHRFVTSFHYAPTFTWGVQVGGVFTAESGLPLSATIVSGSLGSTGAFQNSASNGAGGSFRAPFEARNSYRQDGRKTFDLRISKEFGLGGRRRLVALAESFNIFNWRNNTGFTDTKYRPAANATFDAATNTVTMILNDEPAFLRPTAASNTLFGPRDAQLGLKFLW